MANSDKECKWLKEEGGETATYIKKKKKRQYQSIVSGTANPRGLPEPLANDGL